MVFESFLDPVFSPLLTLSPLVAILLISFGITLIITIIYKFTTNQESMRRLKKEMKDLQLQLKTLAKTDPKKAMSMQKKVMEKNFQYMKHSLKPTLFTFIPLIIIFGWLNSNMAYYPISPNQPFTVSAEFDKYIVSNATLEVIPELEFINSSSQPVKDGIASWQLKGNEGEYAMTIMLNEKQYSTKLLISSARKYEKPVTLFKNSDLKKITIENRRVRPFGDWFNIFGWYPGWLATYILSSLLFSYGLRKAMRLV